VASHPPSIAPEPSPAVNEPSARDVLAVRFHLTSATLAVVVFVLGLAVIGGWLLHIDTLKSVFPGYVTMKMNAAICLVLSGAALWMYRAQNFTPLRDNAVRYLASAAVLISLLTLVEYATGWNLHIDELLVADDPGSFATIAPGRMALATCVCLLLFNAALIIADRPHRYGAAQALIGGALLVATLNGVGYFFGVDVFSGLATYSAMAVHTSASILLLCAGFLFARPSEGLMDAAIDVGPGGVVIRRLVPIVVCAPIVLAWISWLGVRQGWYQAGFAMTLFVALTINVLAYVIWAGGLLLRGFEEKRVAAERLRMQSEERLRRAVADAPVPMVIHDDADHILHMSRGWSEYSGYTLQDTPTITDWTARAQPGASNDVRVYLNKVSKATETVHGGEAKILSKSGAERVWEFSTTPLGDLGTHRAFVTTAVDVTERKQAEADLRKMNESLEHRIEERTAELTRANDTLKRQSDQVQEQAALLDLVRDGIIVRDLYGTIVYWSEGAADMYGYTRDEALGRVSHTLLKVSYPLPRQTIEQLVISKGFWEGEVVQVTKDDQSIAVESRWTLTRTDRGVPQGFLEVNRDISARKHAEDSLRDSEVRFRAVAETANEGIVTADAQGTVRYWNPGAARMFGRSADEIVGHPLTLLLPEPHRTNYIQQGADNLVGKTVELTGLRKDGTTFSADMSLSRWENTQGRFYTAILRDVTDRKNAERELEAKAEELSRSNQELEQFAYVASHDLQEPLRMVSNYTQLLARRYKDKLDQDANEFIDFAVDGAKRMQALIHDLLQYARVGTRGREMKPTPAAKVITEALTNLAGAIDEAKAQVDVSPMPTVNCDSGQLTLVFQNLIGNAIKFRRAEGTPTVRVTAEQADDVWVFAVRDNGIGIDPKYFDRIFQMFQRLHTRTEYPGTGIGLALCKKIIERHGGRIRVESTPGQGTTFSFTMPVAH